jgi:hypothetical protein
MSRFSSRSARASRAVRLLASLVVALGLLATSCASLQERCFGEGEAACRTLSGACEAGDADACASAIDGLRVWRTRDAKAIALLKHMAALQCLTCGNPAFCQDLVDAIVAGRFADDGDIPDLETACRSKSFAPACTLLGRAFREDDPGRAAGYFEAGCFAADAHYVYVAPAIPPHQSGRSRQTDNEPVYSCAGLHKLWFKTYDGGVWHPPVLTSIPADKLVQLSQRFDELRPHRSDPDSANVQSSVEEQMDPHPSPPVDDPAPRHEATSDNDESSEAMSSADRAQMEQETRDVANAVGETARRFAEERAILGRAERNRRRQNAGASRGAGGSAGLPGKSAGCEETCRRFDSCGSPYNRCIHACPRGGPDGLPDPACQNSCEQGRISCQRAAGSVCGAFAASSSSCCTCSIGAD